MMKENDETFTGNELDEDGEEDSDPIKEGEYLKGNENQGEEKEIGPVKGEEGNSEGNENEGEEKESEPITEGENLRNTKNEGEGKESEPVKEEENSKGTKNEGEEKESDPVKEGKDLKSKETTYKGRKRLIILIVLGVCLLSGAGYLFLKIGKTLIQREKTHLVERYEIPKSHNITFHSFIIPFKENDNFTYISLSITLNLPNKEVKRQIMGNKDRLRGVLYDILKEEINRFKEIPPMEGLKGLIKRGIDEVLANEKVNEVYIDQFLAG